MNATTFSTQLMGNSSNILENRNAILDDMACHIEVFIHFQSKLLCAGSIWYHTSVIPSIMVIPL